MLDGDSSFNIFEVTLITIIRMTRLICRLEKKDIIALTVVNVYGNDIEWNWFCIQYRHDKDGGTNKAPNSSSLNWQPATEKTIRMRFSEEGCTVPYGLYIGYFSLFVYKVAMVSLVCFMRNNTKQLKQIC